MSRDPVTDCGEFGPCLCIGSFMVSRHALRCLSALVLAGWAGSQSPIVQDEKPLPARPGDFVLRFGSIMT